MADVPMIVEGNGGFGGAGAGMGAGFIGGLVLGSLWNGGGFGGWGNRGAGQVGADVALAGSIQNVANQVQAGTISQLQSAAGVTGAVNQQTIANLQGQNAIQQQMCCATGRLSQEIDNTGDQTVAAINATNLQMTNGMANLGQAITSQGYENRLQAQALAAQLQSQHAALSAQIASENCADRELMARLRLRMCVTSWPRLRPRTPRSRRPSTFKDSFRARPCTSSTSSRRRPPPLGRNFDNYARGSSRASRFGDMTCL